MIKSAVFLFLLCLLVTPLSGQSLSPLEFYELNCIEVLRSGAGKTLLQFQDSQYMIRPLIEPPAPIRSRLLTYPQSRLHYENYRRGDKIGLILGSIGAAAYLYIPYMSIQSQSSTEENMGLLMGSIGFGIISMVTGAIILEKSRVELSRSINYYNQAVLDTFFQELEEY